MSIKMVLGCTGLLTGTAFTTQMTQLADSLKCSHFHKFKNPGHRLLWLKPGATGNAASHLLASTVSPLSILQEAPWTGWVSCRVSTEATQMQATYYYMWKRNVWLTSQFGHPHFISQWEAISPTTWCIHTYTHPCLMLSILSRVLGLKTFTLISTREPLHWRCLGLNPGLSASQACTPLLSYNFSPTPTQQLCRVEARYRYEWRRPLSQQPTAQCSA